MRNFTLLILWLAVPQTWASICEDEIKPVTAIVRILETSLKLRDLNVEQVENALLGATVENPFASTERDIRNLSFRNTFEKHRLRLKPAHTETLHAQTRALLERFKAQNLQVDAAREQTKYIFLIQQTGEVPVTLSAAGISQGTLEGRPVFVGKFFDGHAQSLRLIDPTHPDPARKLVNLADKLREDDESGVGSFLQVNGDAYFVRLSKGRTYTLKYGHETRSPLYDGPAAENRWPQIITLPEHKKIVSAWFLPSWPGEDRTAATIWSWDLSGKAPRSETPSEPTPPTKTSLYVNSMGGHAIAGFVPDGILPENKMLFTDFAHEPKLFAKVELQKPQWQFKSRVNPLAYIHRGRWYALAMIYDSRKRQHSLAQLDLQSGKLLRKINVPGFDPHRVSSLKFERVNGVPVAVIVAGGQVVFLDLRTRKALWPSHEVSIVSHALFQWRNKTYVVFSTMDHELQIRTMDNGDILSRTTLKNASAGDVFTFEQDGHPMAFATSILGQNPLFFSLLHTEDK